MSRATLALTPELHQYLLDVSLREPAVLQLLREETAGHPKGKMQIAPEQGQFMALLVKLMQARKALEVGVFTGYSSLAIALALPDDGQIIACDISEEFTTIATRYWQAAGVAHKIDLRLAPAADTLAHLIASGEHGTFDIAFIDADKEMYDSYYEYTLRLLRPGGLVLIDNVLRGGAVAGPPSDNSETAAIQRLNVKLHHDPRIRLSLVPIGDGLTLAQKI